jgi:membrane associated rhomboid family serine protease
MAWAFLVCFFYVLSQRMELTAFGLMDSDAVRQGQWWRLFTAIWLHADLAHLAGNVTMGSMLLGLAMARFNKGIALLTSYLAGVAGNVIALLFSVHPHHSLGASGMVMGGLGLLAAHSFYLWRRVPTSTKHVATRLVGGVMLFVLLGLAPGTDTLAHFGGFISGGLQGGLANFAPKFIQKPWVNLISGLIFALLVAAPWWLALH